MHQVAKSVMMKNGKTAGSETSMAFNNHDLPDSPKQPDPVVKHWASCHDSRYTES